MALTVVVRSGDHATPLKVSFDAPRIVIGRGEGCEVRLPDPSVSQRHASIRQRGSDYVVMDEGSTNGTFAGPVRLSPQAPRVVQSGELLRVGRIWLQLTIEAVPVTDDAQLATREIALSLVAAALAAQGEAAAVRLMVESGPDQGRELAIVEFDRAYSVGRGPGLDLTLADPDASRRHIEVTRRGQSLWVKDLGSKNGALLDGLKLQPKRDTLWPRGKPVTLGATSLTFEDPVAEALVEIEASSDEKMRDEDAVEPPTSVGTNKTAPENRAVAPIAHVTRHAVRREHESDGFRPADLAVALLALLVLAASLGGLFWLFRLK